MLNTVLAFVAKWTVGKKLLGGVAWLHDKADGKRSEIILAVTALIHALKIIGVLSPEAAGAIEAILLPLLPLTLADKASKIMKTVDKVVPQP